jgi:putative flippase GtrA
MNVVLRWGKYNAVGAMGMAVQLGSLATLNRLWPGHYLVATAVALELTLAHNFVWHLNFTWRDRNSTPEARSACRGWRLVRRNPAASQFVRFQLSNGLVSLAGNLALMPVLVEAARIPVVAANMAAIVCCSILNFCLAHYWAFAGTQKMNA